jgi:regulator of protease activity HflC (stomatin/prohibitin superfamily)
MASGLLKLIEIIQQIWENLKPYAAVMAWEHGSVLRWGRVHRELSPGYYFKWPIAEKMIVVLTALTSMRGPVQTIGDKHFRWTMKYRVVNTEAYVANIVNETDFLRDITTAQVAGYMGNPDRDSWENLVRRLRSEADEGGFEIVKLRLVDDVKGRALRLFGDVGEVE